MNSIDKATIVIGFVNCADRAAISAISMCILSILVDPLDVI